MSTTPTRPADIDSPEAFRAWWWGLSSAERRAYLKAQDGLTAPQRVAQQRAEAREAREAHAPSAARQAAVRRTKDAHGRAC